MLCISVSHIFNIKYIEKIKFQKFYLAVKSQSSKAIQRVGPEMECDWAGCISAFTRMSEWASVKAALIEFLNGDKALVA